MQALLLFTQYLRMHIHSIIGLLGDLLTFSGGLFLALDAVQKEKEFNKIKRVAAALRTPYLAKLKVEIEGLIISDDQDVERAFIRHSARKAVVGCVVLTLGFLLLLAARILEIANGS